MLKQYRDILILFGILVALAIASMFITTEGMESNEKINEYKNQFYDHYDGTTQSVSTGTVYYGENGGSVTITNNPDGTQSLTLSDGTTFAPSSAGTFTGPNGVTATIVRTDNGLDAVKIDTKNGSKLFIRTDNGTTSYSATSSSYPSNSSSTSYPTTNNGQMDQQMNNGQNNSTGTYDSSLPTGIRASQIPPGDEDLYILKSQVVPPVCPACTTMTYPRESKCRPCKPCGRCPEPSMTCKAVPNYNAIGNNNTANGSTYLPVPVLNDFSSF
jgi:hypothetical protein